MPDQPQTIHSLDLLRRKRDRHELSDAEIRYVVDAVVAAGVKRDQLAAGCLPAGAPESATITDAQLGALLMAIYQHGLSARELATLTDAMRFSGETFDASSLQTFTVDKHSTGGVGDKTSLLIAPLVAAAGIAHRTPAGVPGICVPMISGRSLGHTGGTLDKLETIPGFNTQLSLVRFAEVLRQAGAALIGQTPTLVPADRLLYAMRDHTGTVESPFLITASIMSKKLAESLNALVLDVKVGSGAFLPSLDQARELATLMVETGTRAGTTTVALLTRMDEPLGRFAGNWIEVAECVDILQGRPGPLSRGLIQLSITLAGTMLHLAGRVPDADAGRTLAQQLLDDGSAWQAWLRITEAQGADTSVFADPMSHHKPLARRTLTASEAGYLSSMDCKQVGWAVQRLGAGRAYPGGPVSAHAGVEMHAELGDSLHAGQPIITLFTEDPAHLDSCELMLRDAFEITAKPPEAHALVQEIITAQDL